MIHEKIYFSKIYPEIYMESYIHDAHAELAIGKRKTIIVCPGGGYVFLSEREAEPVALQYFAAGMNAFVLRYGIGEAASDYAPAIQAAEAIKHLREHCDELYVDPECICITGFSAGGHLSASASVMWKNPRVYGALGFNAPAEICRPTAAVLCYPVISSKHGVGHIGSFIALCGGSTDPEEHKKYSLENLVDSDTPPTFIWHTSADTCVPAENSLYYASALSAAGVKYELHIYTNHDHGISLASKETWSQIPSMVYPHAQGWIGLAIEWILGEEYK